VFMCSFCSGAMCALSCAVMLSFVWMVLEGETENCSNYVEISSQLQQSSFQSSIYHLSYLKAELF